jgi:protease II
MGGIYSEVGYLDAFRTILNRDLPLTEIETDEFGLPAMRIEDGRAAIEWSPMDLLKPKGTPGMWQIVRTALNDKEVLAYESVKWILRSRAGRTAEASDIYLAIPGGQGHFTAPPGAVRQQAEDACLILALAQTQAAHK